MHLMLTTSQTFMKEWKLKIPRQGNVKGFRSHPARPVRVRGAGKRAGCMLGVERWRTEAGVVTTMFP